MITSYIIYQPLLKHIMHTVVHTCWFTYLHKSLFFSHINFGDLNLAHFLLDMQASMDIINRFLNSESCDIHLNHGDLWEAIWSWIGIKVEHRRKVAEVYLLYSYWMAFGNFRYLVYGKNWKLLLVFTWSFSLCWVLCVLSHLKENQNGW